MIPVLVFTRLAGCSVDNRKQIMANVMVTGGNTLFEGLPQMLYKKLKSVGIALACMKRPCAHVYAGFN